MAVFYKQTNHIPLFGSSGDFYAQAEINVTKDVAKKQFTVTVNGIAAYSKYGWNFTTHLTASLANNSSGSGEVSDTGSISPSGYNSYTGWLPSKGYNNSASVSKTFNYNSDGTIPDVYLKFTAYNGTVYYISGGYNVKVSTSYHDNIKADIKNAIGELDVSAADFSLEKTLENSTKIGFKTKLNSKNTNSPTKWHIKVDGSSFTVVSSSNIEKSYNVINSTHVIEVQSENKYGTKSAWKKLNYDTILPTIDSKDLIPISVNKAILQYDCSHDCNWSLSSSNMDTVTGTGKIVNTEVTVASDIYQLYTLTLTRKDNSNLSTSTNIYCNTIIPKLTCDVSTVADALHVKVTSNNVPCKDWKFEVLKVEDESEVITVIAPPENNGLYFMKTIISNLQLEVPYILRISATNDVNRGLTTSITSDQIICHGCVYILNDSDNVLAAVMIYDEKNKHDWVGSIPYIYDLTYDNKKYNDERKHWRMTTIKK